MRVVKRRKTSRELKVILAETDKFYLFDSHYDRARIIFNKNQISGKAGFVLNTPFDNNFYYIENIENPDDAGMINALPSNQAKRL